MEDILLIIEHEANDKNGRNRDIAKYLLEYDGNYIDLKIADIVRDTFVSTAAVTRFAQNLGLSGFPELKIMLHNAIKVKKTYNNEGALILEKYVMDVNKSLDQTFKMLNYQDVIISANVIYNAKNIVMCCIGNNKLPANDFQQKLIRINKNVKFDPDYHLQYVSACNLNKEDVAIGLSYSGLSSEVIMCLDVAKKNGAKTIFLTSNTQRFFDYDFVFYLDKSESLYRKSSMTSRTSFQVILDLIFLELYQNDPNTFDAISEKNRLIK